MCFPFSAGTGIRTFRNVFSILPYLNRETGNPLTAAMTQVSFKNW